MCGTDSALLRHCAWYSQRARTCTHAHLRAGEYVLGPANTNACPAGSAKITMEATCRAAAVFVGKVYRRSELHVSRPGGCFFDIGDVKVDFNTNATGASVASAQPLCQVAGAPRARGCVYSFRVLTVYSRGRIQY
jgi:hypothetical protein